MVNNAKLPKIIEHENFIFLVRSFFPADRLQLLAEDPHRRVAKSEAALQRVKQLGGWTEHGNQMAHVMKDLIE
jgi:hypothetical protein